MFIFQANRIRGIVIVERTPASDQYFKDVQIFCGLEIGLSVVPVSGPIEAAGFLKQLVRKMKNCTHLPF